MFAMTHWQKIKRALNRLGFVYIDGWVRENEAPAIRRKIEAARAEVEAIKASERSTNETGNRQ